MANIHTPIPALKLNDGNAIPMVRPTMSTSSTVLHQPSPLRTYPLCIALTQSTDTLPARLWSRNSLVQNQPLLLSRRELHHLDPHSSKPRLPPPRRSGSIQNRSRARPRNRPIKNRPQRPVHHDKSLVVSSRHPIRPRNQPQEPRSRPRGSIPNPQPVDSRRNTHLAAESMEGDGERQRAGTGQVNRRVEFPAPASRSYTADGESEACD